MSDKMTLSQAFKSVSTVYAADEPHAYKLVRTYRAKRQNLRPDSYAQQAGAFAGFAHYCLHMARESIKQAGGSQFPRYHYKPIHQADGFTYLGEKPEDFGLRFVGYADTGRGYFTDTTEHTGFYCDAHASETCFGVVYQLPARKGVARYVAGYDFTDRDGGLVLNLKEVFESDCRDGSHWDGAQDNDAARDAAKKANEHARIAAEKEREYSTAWQAGSWFAQLGQEVAELQSELRGILSELKEYKHNPVLPTLVPSLCNALRAQVSTMLEDIKAKREKRNELRAGDDESFYFYPSPELIAAFNEGAEI